VEGDVLKLSVRDNGRGIAESDVAHVFERFYQVDHPQDHVPGTGIGLAICKELAEVLGGSIAVESEPGYGSTFFVTIPYISADPDEIRTEVDTDIKHHQQLQASRSDTSVGQKFGGKILIVEDNASMRDFLRTELSEYQVVEQVNGHEGLQSLRKMHGNASLPDCIISDVMMPVMDGFEMVTEIKKDAALNKIPVVMLTARAGLEDKLEGLRIGVDDYIRKPFDILELKARIANLIARIPAKRAEESAGDPVTGIDQRWLQLLEQNVIRNISRSDFTINALADTMQISRRQLYRKIKLYTGLAANEYVREVRLFEARKLLEERSVRTVAELAYAVGFEDPDYFSRIYMERFGYRPSKEL
jgi:DNA-binding response OmpR family regulator